MHRSRKSYVYAVFALVISLFASSTPAQATFTILGSFPIITTAYGVGSVPIVPPTTNSPAPWVFTSSNTKVATISGKTINVVGAGTSTITASQAATGSFTARSRSTQIRVSQGTPTIGIFAPQSILITQRTYALVPPTSTSDGGWSFISTNPNIASVAGSLVTFHTAGSVLIYASQSNTPNWKSATASMKFTVVPIAPVLGTFGDISVTKDSVASVTLVSPKSSSPGVWTFTSSNPTIASIDRNTVTPLAFGTTVITAIQAAAGDFAAATATMTFTVLGPVPTLGIFSDLIAQMASAPYVNIAPPTSTSTGAWSLTTSDPTIVALSGGIATLLKPGVTTITATQAPTTTFASPAPVSMKLTVVGTPKIGTWSDIQKVVNDPDFALTPPTSTSSGSWSYSSSDTSVIAIVDGMAKVTGAGRATITATQAATNIWSQGATSMSIEVFGHIPTLGTFAPITATLGDAPKQIAPPTSNSSGTWKFTSSDPKIATISGTSLVIVGVGTAVISATQSAAGAYSQSNTVQTQATVKAKASPSPSPSSTVKPTPTPSPTVKPTPTPTADATKPPVNATIKVTATGRVITVVAIGVKALVFINGKPGKVGNNSVKPGIASIVITIDDKVVYRRVFTIK